MSIRSFVVLTLICCAPVFAQTGATKQSQPASLTVDGIVFMVEACLSDDWSLRAFARKVSFSTSARMT
jgi:methylmalonyl-CoA mutase N-terminal domain/subunit